MKKQKENKKVEQKKIYSFAVPGIYKGFTAEEAANELDRIKTRYGKLDPEDVVRESVQPDSVLHNVFQWDDTKAAESYRKEQARKLICSIRVEIVNNTIAYNVRAYVNVRENKDESRSYVPIQKAIENDHAYADLLNQSKDEMNAFVIKYSQISELNAVKAEMLKAINLIDTK